MNRKFFSFLVLFVTTIIIGGIFYLVENNYSEGLKGSSNMSFENRQDKEYNSSNKELYDNKILEELEDNKEHIASYDKNYRVSEKDLNEKSKFTGDLFENEVEKNNDNNDKENIKIKDEIKKQKDYIENNNIKKENSVEKNFELEKIKVFKVDKYSIPKRISKKDKLKLMSIAKNLSIQDYFKLLEHVKRNDELDAAVDIFRILKDKLEKEEYDLIKEIMDPYMNIELIEERI